ncbi:hypothetical protein HZC53_04990 [Candidatus Uhrbacteria bacterium]|nr:hypothetical protein [Candidatus Uhrbacteria bacterium]
MNSLAINDEQAISVKWHAVTRRLQAERASEEETDWILENHFRIAVDIMRSELAQAVEMTAEATSIFMHPGRVAKLGLVKPSTYFDRAGRKVEGKGYRRNDGRYFWTGDLIMVVDGDVVVTCILPNERQIQTLHDVMPAAREVRVPMRSIVQAARTAASFMDPISQVYTIERPKTQFKAPRSVVFKREPPPTAKWLKKPGATWTVLVVDDLQNANELARRAANKLREDAGQGYPTVFVENVECRTAKAVFERLQNSKSMRARKMPDMPAIDWSKQANDIPNSARRWWSEMLEAGQQQGKLLCVVTPETAKAILETAFGSSDAAWRRRPDACRPGSTFKIRDMCGSLMVDWSAY